MSTPRPKAIGWIILGVSVTAAIFWLKTKAGWKETDRIEHSGKIETINLEFVTTHNES